MPARSVHRGLLIRGILMVSKRVVISVSGGVAEVVSAPEGIDVIVKDYDIDGCDREHLKQDDYGWYSEQIWPGG